MRLSPTLVRISSTYCPSIALLRPLFHTPKSATRTLVTTTSCHYGIIMEKPKLFEGLLAVNKPSGISSGEAIRKLVSLFSNSSLFAETLAWEKSKREVETSKQRKRRRGAHRAPEVKVGHGGTLDPMASGVLVIGIGAGTKQLQAYLTGTKTYEATAMFGCDTDSYDAVGQIIHRRPHAHITEELVEAKLERFRGPHMQKPPVFSALNHQGKRYYEYAREGIPLPVEIKPRQVETEVLKLLEFTREHEYKFPQKEVTKEEKMEAAALVEAVKKEPEAETRDESKSEETTANTGEKRSASPIADAKDAKKVKTETDETAAATTTSAAAAAAESIKPEEPSEPIKPEGPSEGPSELITDEGAPTVRLLMSVTKGFYVRSFVYDLGTAVSSAAHMVKLVRTQQGQWELGKNVFEWEELMGESATEDGENGWGKKVEGALWKWAKARKEKS